MSIQVNREEWRGSSSTKETLLRILPKSSAIRTDLIQKCKRNLFFYLSSRLLVFSRKQLREVRKRTTRKARTSLLGKEMKMELSRCRTKLRVIPIQLADHLAKNHQIISHQMDLKMFQTSPQNKERHSHYLNLKTHTWEKLSRRVRIFQI